MRQNNAGMKKRSETKNQLYQGAVITSGWMESGPKFPMLKVSGWHFTDCVNAEGVSVPKHEEAL